MDNAASSSNSPSIHQSLHEIASLLVLVHDVYLKEARGREVSLALLRLVYDVGLQSSVSILDIERIKRHVMAKSTSDMMGYEIFYDWLRHISRYLFANTERDPRKSLHLLLTQYIIPCAASKFDNTLVVPAGYVLVSEYFRKITDKAWKVLAEYADFIQYWYLHILNSPPQVCHYCHAFILYA